MHSKLWFKMESVVPDEKFSEAIKPCLPKAGLAQHNYVVVDRSGLDSVEVYHSSVVVVLFISLHRRFFRLR